MTQPPQEPPPYGTPPPGQLPPQPSGNGGNTADVVLSWVLFVGQIFGTIALGLIAIFSIFVTDSCGSNASDTVPSVCDSDYFGSVLVGYWITLLVLLVATLIGLIVATSRKKPAWPWPVGGCVITGIATIIFFTLMSR
ncbi:MAG: hypothetical protein ABIN55_02180 [Aeromicrobium sp.]